MVNKTNTISAEEQKKQRDFAKKIKKYNEDIALETGKTRKAFVLTLGCQQNESDSEKLSGMAEQMGYEIVDEPDEASLIMVNTCAIREHAEQRALSLVGQYKHLKAKNKELIIVICGCMVVQEHRRNDIKMKYPYVEILFGTSSIHRLPEFIFEKLNKGKRILASDETEYRVAEGLPIRRSSEYHAWVSVMYGCNNFCSYCIVPYVRGRERSRMKEEIISEVRDLVSQGYKDITLLGQNVNSYGKDLGTNYDFADLLAELDAIDGEYWIHFMTSHPKDATKKLIDVMSTSKHIARCFHLPLQSGSDEILKAMNRKYDFKTYIEKVDYIREKMPDAVITSDIIVGFPGESEEDFECTVEALKRASYDMIFSFIYSPRKGTPAAEMDCQIEASVKSARFDRLLETQNAISLESNKKYEGKTVKVLCDGPSKNNSAMFSGRTEGGKIVLFEGNPAQIGKFVDVYIEKGDTFALNGKIKN